MGTPVSLDDGGSIILTFDMEISSGAGGTGFDLQDLILAGGPQVKTGAVDLAHIVIIRIVDVIGDIANGGATTDHLGRAVADPSSINRSTFILKENKHVCFCGDLGNR